MPKYVIERDMPGVGNLAGGEMKSASENSNAALAQIGKKIQWVHSYVTGDRIYCIYIAPDEATIREHARLTGLPANRISPVTRIIDPTTGGL